MNVNIDIKGQIFNNVNIVVNDTFQVQSPIQKKPSSNK